MCNKCGDFTHNTNFIADIAANVAGANRRDVFQSGASLLAVPIVAGFTGQAQAQMTRSTRPFSG
jgi:hypothetical protein